MGGPVIWEEQLKEADAFAREYMDFLDAGKTERECVDTLVNLIEKEKAIRN